MSQKPILHVLDVHEELNGETFFVAQCLEYNIRGIGGTVDEARARFVSQLNAFKRRALLEGMENPFAGLQPAPQRFWDLFKAFQNDGGDVEKPYW